MLASGVSARGGKRAGPEGAVLLKTLECAHLATLKDLKPSHKLRLKIIGPDLKPLTLTVRVLELLEAGLYEDVTLEVIA